MDVVFDLSQVRHDSVKNPVLKVKPSPDRGTREGGDTGNAQDTRKKSVKSGGF